MAKWQDDGGLDAALDYWSAATKMTACTAQPTTFAEATNDFMLAEIVIDSGDFAKANGDTNGRKVTIAEQADVTVTNTGDATHVALVKTADSSLLYVTTCTAATLTATSTVTFPAWDIEIADAA